MKLTEDDIFEKYAKQCTRNPFLPYEYDRSCVACGYNVIKAKK